MSLFEPALQYVLLREGGIEEQATDPGGISNRGISFRTLKETPPERLRMYGIPIYVTEDTVRELSVEQASSFYKGEFWDHAPFDKINNQALATYLFDACVNMGLAPGIKCLQRAIWSARSNRAILVDDGILGENTLKHINTTESVLLLSAMRSERGGEYRLIAQSNPTQNNALDGWLNRSYNKSL